MSGPKTGGQRAKLSKHMRSKTTKKFRNETPENLEKYKKKIKARADRKAARRKRR